MSDKIEFRSMYKKPARDFEENPKMRVCLTQGTTRIFAEKSCITDYGVTIPAYLFLQEMERLLYLNPETPYKTEALLSEFGYTVLVDFGSFSMLS